MKLVILTLHSSESIYEVLVYNEAILHSLLRNNTTYILLCAEVATLHISCYLHTLYSIRKVHVSMVWYLVKYRINVYTKTLF